MELLAVAAVLLVLLEVLLAACAAEGSVIVEPAHVRGIEFATPPMEFSGDFDLGLVAVLPFPSSWCNHGCQGPAGATVGAADVVLIQTDRHGPCFRCGFERLAIMSRDFGAKGIIVLTAFQVGHRRVTSKSMAFSCCVQ